MITQLSDDDFSNGSLEAMPVSDGPARTIVTPEMQTSSRESASILMDSIAVHNDKVRYYYNKTLCLREPIADMLDTLHKLHASTFAYLNQFPDTGDYSVIATLFELIPSISTMIDWNSMNHSCYWDDFRRETKELMILLDRVNIAALKCSGTATKVFTQAQDLFQGAVGNEKRDVNVDRAAGHLVPPDFASDAPNGQNIQIHWEKPGDFIELLWHDADGGLLKVLLKQTGTGFRLRFLRHIIYHARTSLESAYLTFMRLNVALHLHIPLEKLTKCEDIPMRQLTLQEQTCLTKAKREFDSSLDTIWQMVSRFKFQAFHLQKYATTFKKMRKSKTFVPKTAPTFVSLTMTVDDSLLMRVMSCGIQAQAKEESFDFTMFPDRTEDVISKVEELLTVDRTSFLTLQTLLGILKIALPQEKPNFTVKESDSAASEIQMILAHRFQIRRTLKKSIELFDKHSAFHKMEKLKLLPTIKFVSQKGQNNTFLETESSDETDADSLRDHNNNEKLQEEKIWIGLEGGLKATLDASRGILINCLSGNDEVIRPYKDLTLNERIIFIVRLLRQLLIHTANEQCWTKICHGRIAETKSLVKRLKAKDRLNPDLQNAILDLNKHLRLLLHLTKTIRFLKLIC